MSFYLNTWRVEAIERKYKARISGLTLGIDKCMKLPALIPLEHRLARPGLRIGFNAIKSKTPTKEKLRNMIILWDWHRGSEMAYFLNLWRVEAINRRCNARIAGLTLAIEKCIKLPELLPLEKRLARPALRVGFSAIKAKTPTKEKLRNMIILWDWHRGSEMAYFLNLWRVEAVNRRCIARIAGHTLATEKCMKLPGLL